MRNFTMSGWLAPKYCINAMHISTISARRGPEFPNLGVVKNSSFHEILRSGVWTPLSTSESEDSDWVEAGLGWLSTSMGAWSFMFRSGCSFPGRIRVSWLSHWDSTSSTCPGSPSSLDPNPSEPSTAASVSDEPPSLSNPSPWLSLHPITLAVIVMAFRVGSDIFFSFFLVF